MIQHLTPKSRRRAGKVLSGLLSLAVGTAACSDNGDSGTEAAAIREQIEQCPTDDIVSYVGDDLSDTARSDEITLNRRDAVEAEAERVAACGGVLRLVAFSASATDTVILFDGPVEAEGDTTGARARRVDDAIEPVMMAYDEQRLDALDTLPGGGSDIIGQLTLVREYFGQYPSGVHRGLILTDGIQTTGQAVTNVPDFTDAAAADLAGRLALPDLPGSSLTLAGIGRVAGESPPTEFTDALKTFFRTVCAGTNATTCLVVTDLTSTP